MHYKERVKGKMTRADTNSMQEIADPREAEEGFSPPFSWFGLRGKSGTDF
jgi:hypothetical protein